MRPFLLFWAGAWLALVCPLPAAPAAAPELPFEFQRNVPIPMRDGIKLVANVFLPRQGGPFPVLLQRTPYGKMNELSGEVRRYCAAGFAVVVQDCRGRGASPGEWDPFRYDGEDGFDTQEWTGRQPWCDGQIGTFGGSYVGWTQWAAAVRGSQYLRCMVPVVPFTDAYHEIANPGGAFQLALSFGWGSGVGGLNLNLAGTPDPFKFLPLNRWDEQGARRVPFLREWVAHPLYDDYWKARTIQGRFDRVNVPVLNIGGWYDIFSKPTLDHVAQVRQSSTNRLARRNQFVLIGPWGHSVGGQKLGELDFGAAARVDTGKLQLEWFQYWLKNQETGVQNWPMVRLFVMGENTWRNEHEWPLARTRYTPWYFRSGGKAATRNGDGQLQPQPPGQEPADQFTYDPADPVPTRGGNNLMGAPAGPFDQSAVENRPDVLVYTCAPLEQAMEVTGPVKVILHAASTARDTDFTAKLVDVHPDGKAYNLCDGVQRARFRVPGAAPSLLTPGQVCRYEIDLWATSNLFQPGHRIRVEISSSNFPRYDRNPNTGHDFGVDAELASARQTVWHDTERASCIVLPIIPR